MSRIDWKTLAAWIDTEGSISSRISRVKGRAPFPSHRLEIEQDEKGPLEKLKAFLAQRGTEAKIRRHRFRETERAWSLRVFKIRDLENHQKHPKTHPNKKKEETNTTLPPL